jgi:hypothetical protein
MHHVAVAAAVTCAVVLSACDSNDGAGRYAKTVSGSLTSPLRAGTPLPGDFTPLKAGETYRTRKFRPVVEITPEAGLSWTTQTGDSPEHLSVALEDSQPIDQAIVALHRVDRVYDPRKGGVIPGDQVPFDGDFADWLTGHPRLRTTRPRNTELAGLHGVRVDLVGTKSSPARVPGDCGKVGAGCVPLFHDGLDPVLYAEGPRGRFIVLELDGGQQLVVEEFVEPASRFRQGLKALGPTLDSITLGR